VDRRWLIRLFQEAGLEADQAEQAGQIALARMIRRERPRDAVQPVRRVTDFMVRDPLASLARIVGWSATGLPFVDLDGSLSNAAVTDAFLRAGLDPIVAMAFARVVVEAYTARDFYQPLWEGLGHKGPVDLRALAQLDWSPLRAQFPELASQEPEAPATVVTRVAAPKPPVRVGRPADKK